MEFKHRGLLFAVRHRMRGNIYQSHPGRLENPTLTQFERLVRGQPEDVAAVNREIIAYCQRKHSSLPQAHHQCPGHSAVLVDERRVVGVASMPK